MKLFTTSIFATLMENGRNQEPVRGTENEIDFVPVIKIFNPCGAGTWLLTEFDIEDNDIAFGLCDLGMGTPELGSVRISELVSIRGSFGLPLERDRFFDPKGKTLSQYATEAAQRGCIVA